MEPFWAHGTVVTIGSVEIGGMLSISGPDRTRGEYEKTHAGSGGTRRFGPGLRDLGSMTLEGRKIPGDPGQLALLANYNAASAEAIEELVITYPEGAVTDSSGVPTSDILTQTFDCFVTAYSENAPLAEDEAVGFSATVRVAGDFTESSI